MIPLSALAYIFATALTLVVYGTLQACIVPLYAMAGRFPSLNGISIFQLFAALMDWSSCIFSVLAGLMVSPKLREKNRAIFAGLLSLMIGSFQLGCAVAVFNYASSLGGQIVPLSVVYYGGLLSLCAVACLVYEQISVKGDMARSMAMEELSRPSPLASAFLPESRAAFRKAMAEKQAAKPDLVVNGEGAFFDFDLILLEDSLLKMKPDRDSYLSALRFGITIEKDTGFRNCRARNYTFAQIMKDVALRLAASEPDNLIFQELSGHFLDYDSLEVEARTQVIVRFEECLPCEEIEKTMLTNVVELPPVQGLVADDKNLVSMQG